MYIYLLHNSVISEAVIVDGVGVGTWMSRIGDFPTDIFYKYDSEATSNI